MAAWDKQPRSLSTYDLIWREDAELYPLNGTHRGLAVPRRHSRGLLIVLATGTGLFRRFSYANDVRVTINANLTAVTFEVSLQIQYCEKV